MRLLLRFGSTASHSGQHSGAVMSDGSGDCILLTLGLRASLQGDVAGRVWLDSDANNAVTIGIDEGFEGIVVNLFRIVGSRRTYLGCTQTDGTGATAKHAALQHGEHQTCWTLSQQALHRSQLQLPYRHRRASSWRHVDLGRCLISDVDAAFTHSASCLQARTALLAWCQIPTACRCEV